MPAESNAFRTLNTHQRDCVRLILHDVGVALIQAQKQGIPCHPEGGQVVVKIAGGDQEFRQVMDRLDSAISRLQGLARCLEVPIHGGEGERKKFWTDLFHDFYVVVLDVGFHFRIKTEAFQRLCQGISTLHTLVGRGRDVPTSKLAGGVFSRTSPEKLVRMSWGILDRILSLRADLGAYGWLGEKPLPHHRCLIPEVEEISNQLTKVYAFGGELTLPQEESYSNLPGSPSVYRTPSAYLAPWVWVYLEDPGRVSLEAFDLRWQAVCVQRTLTRDVTEASRLLRDCGWVPNSDKGRMKVLDVIAGTQATVRMRSAYTALLDVLGTPESTLPPHGTGILVNSTMSGFRTAIPIKEAVSDPWWKYKAGIYKLEVAPAEERRGALHDAVESFFSAIALAKAKATQAVDIALGQSVVPEEASVPLTFAGGDADWWRICSLMEDALLILRKVPRNLQQGTPHPQERTIVAEIIRSGLSSSSRAWTPHEILRLHNYGIHNAFDCWNPPEGDGWMYFDVGYLEETFLNCASSYVDNIITQVQAFYDFMVESYKEHHPLMTITLSEDDLSKALGRATEKINAFLGMPDDDGN